MVARGCPRRSVGDAGDAEQAVAGLGRNGQDITGLDGDAARRQLAFQGFASGPGFLQALIGEASPFGGAGHDRGFDRDLAPGRSGQPARACGGAAIIGLAVAEAETQFERQLRLLAAPQRERLAIAIGNEAPDISRSTLNVGAQFTPELGGGVSALLRADYRRTGRTWWDVYNTTVRKPVDLVDARAGIRWQDWSVTAFATNLFNKKYNAEFSPGGFVFKARPRIYGVEASVRF